MTLRRHLLNHTLATRDIITIPEVKPFDPEAWMAQQLAIFAAKKERAERGNGTN